MNGEIFDDNFVEHLNRYIGETVTIFTTSGGQSGQGFTGVVLSVNKCFVRLITRIGSAPGCALGNACNSYGNSYGNRCCGNSGYSNYGSNYGGGYGQRNLGSVTDIPINRIASFVHNAV
ncbi:MAG: hypothetical protein PHH84_07175 [Oscillospiraceae bacterium]|nr:hypothetical protein [Oscillospiraceae bacterium]MDD4413969.1 hypothetical protein [Oscillospiraceae bacterium]